jgi:hypothetical protein
MTITTEQLYTYVSPFIAAGAASWLTYALSIRQKRHEILITEKLVAFKAVQAQLVALNHYCEAAMGEYSGGDFHPRISDLNESEPSSALSQVHELRQVVDKHCIFFSAPVRKNLNGLFQQIYLLASMELIATSDNSFGNPDAYEKVSELVDLCIEELYKELKFPT